MQEPAPSKRREPAKRAQSSQERDEGAGSDACIRAASTIEIASTVFLHRNFETRSSGWRGATAGLPSIYNRRQTVSTRTCARSRKGAHSSRVGRSRRPGFGGRTCDGLRSQRPGATCQDCEQRRKLRLGRDVRGPESRHRAASHRRSIEEYEGRGDKLTEVRERTRCRHWRSRNIPETQPIAAG
jgi:hypothetical protein